ncbi:MAG: hypothetical protein AAGE01_15875 [Pseudomonadota bacterium]
MGILRLTVALVLQLLAAAALALPGAGRVITVGPGWDGACDFASLTEALARTEPGLRYEIRLLDQQVHQYRDNAVVDARTLVVRGGWESCSDDARRVPGGRSIIRSGTGGTVLSIAGDGVPRSTRVLLVDIDVVGARTAVDGGGLRISGGATATLLRTRLRDNSALIGGGVLIEGRNTRARLGEGFVVSGNRAQLAGGIRCQQGATILLEDGVIEGNRADRASDLSISDCRVR